MGIDDQKSNTAHLARGHGGDTSGISEAKPDTSRYGGFEAPHPNTSELGGYVDSPDPGVGAIEKKAEKEPEKKPAKKKAGKKARKKTGKKTSKGKK